MHGFVLALVFDGLAFFDMDSLVMLLAVVQACVDVAAVHALEPPDECVCACVFVYVCACVQARALLHCNALEAPLFPVMECQHGSLLTLIRSLLACIGSTSLSRHGVSAWVSFDTN
jgi:hypothetical protein